MSLTDSLRHLVVTSDFFAWYAAMSGSLKIVLEYVCMYTCMSAYIVFVCDFRS